MKNVGQTLAVELAGTALLMFAVNSAAMVAHRISSGNEAGELLASSGATGVALYVLLSLARRWRNGYLNPLAHAVSLLRGDLGVLEVLPLSGLLLLVQGVGALGGAWFASELFSLNPDTLSTRDVGGLGRLISEGAVTAGLVLVLFLAPRRQLVLLVAIFSGVSYWFTTATAFGNPAAILARLYVEGPTGIAPGDALHVLLAQIVGAASGAAAAWAMGGGKIEPASDHGRDV